MGVALNGGGESVLSEALAANLAALNDYCNLDAHGVAFLPAAQTLCAI